MENLPKISVIIPSYNHGAFLERCLLSVIEQGYENIQIIVIDGGSTDNTPEILKKYNNRLNYWVSEPDKGTYEANNKGLAKISGDFWCVVNSDDQLCEGALHAVARSIRENPNEKWFAGGVQYIDEKSNDIGSNIPKPPEKIGGFSFLNGCWISHPAVFLSSSVINEIGVFEKWHLMDCNYWLRMEDAGYQPFIIKDWLAKLRLHNDSKSADQLRLLEELCRVIQSFVTLKGIGQLPEVKKRLKELKSEVFRLRCFDELQKNGKISVTQLLAGIGENVSVVGERWFWGVLKRSLFGIAENDPLLGRRVSDNNGNWN